MKVASTTALPILLTALIRQASSSNIAQGDFTSIGCTTDISSCVPFSDVFGAVTSFDEEVVIPCDQCVTMGGFQGGEEISFLGGVNVQGAWYFPDGTKVALNMKYLVIEGHLAMHSSSKIDGEPSVTFTMVGTDDYYDFIPNPINEATCVNNKQAFCDLGKKGIAVAGGTVDINAMPDTCPAWVKLIGTRGTDPPVLDPSDLPQAMDATDLIVTDFESGSEEWFSSTGAQHTMETTDGFNGSQYVKITRRTKTWQGLYKVFHKDTLDTIKVGATYLVSAAVRLTNNGTPSSCSTKRENCMGVKLHYITNLGEAKWRDLTQVPASGSVPDGEWSFIQATVTFRDEEVADTHKYVMFYFDGPEGGIDFSIDEIKVVPPPQELLPDPTDPCTSLVLNGDAEFNDYLVYPATVNGNPEAFLSVESADGNNYFKLANRNKVYTSIEYSLLLGCIREYAIYEFKGRIKVDSDEPSKLRAFLKSSYEDSTEEDPFEYATIGYCPESSVDIGWVDCSIPMMMTARHAEALSMSLSTMVSDANATVYYDNISFDLLTHPTDKIIVDASVTECWDVGAEILLTSYSMFPDDDNVNKIAAMEVVDDTVIITLENNIEKFTSLEDSDDFAVEVALLSREIRFTHDGIDEVYGEIHGGHMIILQTPETPQLIQGVEFLKFGQAGNIGRYPIHYHISGNNPGSIIAKNTIRDSNQRCIVIHATHNVTIYDNIAYDHFGHCFMVEDGFEQDNVFEKNLGARTKEMPAWNVISVLESDQFASTFWISNPNNYFFGNVAAGSYDTGFWYEFLEMVRGPSVVFDPYYTMNPSSFTFGAFKDQIIHSNVGDGFKLYPNGYFPEEEAVYYNLKSYRNKGDGVLFHNSENLAIDGGVFSDNRVQIEVDKQADKVRVSNAKVIGYSDSFQYAVQYGNKVSHCPAHRPLSGVQLHSFLRFRDSDGYIVENTEFVNFGEEATGGCIGSSAVEMDPQIRDGHFDAFSTLRNNTFVPADMPMGVKFQACGLHDAGIVDLAIHDQTGDFNPNGDGVPGFIVSNSTVMTAFADCIPMEGSCTMYCPNPSDAPEDEICFRGLNIGFSQSEAFEDVLLEVKDTVTNKTNYFTPYFNNFTTVVNNKEVEDVKENFMYTRRRFVTPIMPKGNYIMRFVTPRLEDIWPRFVEWQWEDMVNCSNVITNEDVELYVPPPVNGECDSHIIVNGDVEKGRSHWVHTGSSVAVSDRGFEGNAITTVTRKGPWQGIGQFLDSRCFKEGETYELTAKFKMQDIANNTFYACDYNNEAYMAENACPRFSIRNKKMMGDTIGSECVNSYMYPLAEAVGPTTAGWNDIQGVFTVTKEMAEADAVLLFVEKGKPGSKIYLDEVKMTPFYKGCEDFYHNRDLETGDTRDWSRMGHSEIAIFKPGRNSDFAIKTQFRHAYWASMQQEIDPKCINVGMKYQLSSYVRLKTENGDNWKCNPEIVWGNVATLWEACPVMTIQYWNGNQTSMQDIGRFETFVANDYNHLTGEFIASNELANADKVVVFWNKVMENYTVIVDDFSIKASSDLGCNKLIWNGGLEDGNPGYWYAFGGGRIAMNSPGANGSPNSLIVKERTSNDDGVRHTVEIACLQPGVVYKLTATVTLQKGGRSVGCDSLTTDDNASPARCPQLSIYSETGGVKQLRHVAAVAARWKARQWNEMTGYLTFMANELKASTLYVVINKGRSDADILVDDLDLVPVEMKFPVDEFNYDD